MNNPNPLRKYIYAKQEATPGSEFTPIKSIQINTNFFSVAATLWDDRAEDFRRQWLLAAGQPDSAVVQLRFRQLQAWRQYALTAVLLLGPMREFQGVA